MQHYGFIIAGGGCAGLSLAHDLIHSPLRNRSILIIDRDDKDQNDRTWAFWTDQATPFQSVVLQEWRQLRFITDNGERLISTDPWRYLMIRGDDWYGYIRGLLAQCPNVTWLKAPVRRVEDHEDGAVVWVNDGESYHGEWLFDSMFSLADFQPDLSRTLYLQQHFKGWYIETPDDCFDPSAATIFDFRPPQEGEMRFFYVLPTSPREALIEYVGLPLVDFDVLLDRYIRDILGIKEFRVVSDEIDITPLTDHPFPRRAGQHVMSVGIQGGLVKSSTGYAYTRIQYDSAAIVKSLMDYGHPFDVPETTTPVYRWLDAVMLEVMQRRPTCLKSTFQAMFSKNPGPRIFRFLDERASVADIVRLVMTLPKRPFSAGALRLAVSRVDARLLGRQTPERVASRERPAARRSAS